jgi:hypothetical protein
VPTRRAVLALGASLALLSASAVMGADAIPRDFRLTAEYYPALPAFGADGSAPREWHRWTLTVGADGKAVQEVQRSGRGSPKGIRTRSVKVPRRELEQLVAVVRASNFHFLAPEYAFEVSPAAALVLRITLDERYHEVTVYGPDKRTGDPEVAAFLRVWNQTLRLVPPPNPGQGPE